MRAFALVEDQSELRNLENQLVRAEKLITVGVLSAGIAHEIGSPLAVIRGRAEQVLRAVGTGPRAEDLRVIIKHIDNITSTIRQVLDFSRRQAIERQAGAAGGDRRARPRAAANGRARPSGMRLEVALEEDLPPLAADPDQLQQVLRQPAAQRLRRLAGGRPGAGRRARRTREGLVQIEVVDRGCGIAPEHMNAVFDPFFTTKKRGEGTGLGLPIAASIVRNHGGQINLDSAPGKGTTVTVVWPVAGRTARAAPARRCEPSMRKLRALIVDDVVDMARDHRQRAGGGRLRDRGREQRRGGAGALRAGAGRRRRHRPAHEERRRPGRAERHQARRPDRAGDHHDRVRRDRQRGRGDAARARFTTSPSRSSSRRCARWSSAPAASATLSRENALLRRTLRANASAQQLLGQSPPMRQLRALIERVAGAASSVLISGETGTGKELVALALHADSARADKPFVAVNCAALPEQLLESELFGHARGAFTGALQSRRGLFVEADGGTLFLDEIGDLPLPLQGKLLRVLQSGEVRPVGSETSRRVDVRCVAATHKDLAELVEQGALPRGPVLPPRRAAHPGAGAARASPRTSRCWSSTSCARAWAARRARCWRGSSPRRSTSSPACDWPGNVRQLENLIERLVVTASTPLARLADVQQALGPVRDTDPIAPLLQRPLRLDELESRYIAAILKRVGGQQAQGGRDPGRRPVDALPPRKAPRLDPLPRPRPRRASGPPNCRFAKRESPTAFRESVLRR